MRRHRGHYDITVMRCIGIIACQIQYSLHLERSRNRSYGNVTEDKTMKIAT